MISGIPTKISDLSIGKEQNGGKSGFPSFKKNQIVCAKVIRVLSPSKAELMIAGKKVLADTSIVLTGNQTVKLQFTENGNFKLIKPAFTPQSINALAGIGSSLMDILSNNMDGLVKIMVPVLLDSDDIALYGHPDQQEISTDCDNLLASGNLSKSSKLVRLRDMVLSFSLKSGKPDNKFLPRLLEKSGLLFEKKMSDILKREVSDIGNNKFKKIRNIDINNIVKSREFEKIADSDLKAYILKLMAEPELGTSNLIHNFKEICQTIEKFQIINSHAAESGRYLIPFPVFFNGSFNFGQIFLNLGDKNYKAKKKQRVIKVSLLLTMSELGAVRTDVVLLRKEISGNIQVEDSATCSFVKTMLPDLKFSLNRHGFNVLNMDCKTAAPGKLDAKVFLYNILHNKDKGLNVII